MKKEKYIVWKRCRPKTILVTLMVLIILVSIPLVSSVNVSSTSKIAKNDNLSSLIYERTTFPYDDHEHFLSNSERLVDNVKIRCYGQFDLFMIFMQIIRCPTPFINLEIVHYNNISITIDEHYTLIDTRNNRILYDIDGPGLPWKLQPNWGFTTCTFVNIQWIAAHYIFGPFDLIYTLHIPEDNSSTTVLFHGFVFGVGAKTYNSAGEKLE